MTDEQLAIVQNHEFGEVNESSNIEDLNINPEIELERIYRLMLLLRGAKKNFWYYKNKKDAANRKDTLFQYPPGTVQRWEQELNTLLDKRRGGVQ